MSAASMHGGEAGRYAVALAAIALAGVLLRGIGFRDEQRILWDEGRPEIERLIDDPVGFAAAGLREAWGRPGLIALKTVGLAFDKALRRPRADGFPAMPLAFQIVLDMASLLLIASLMRWWAGGADRARADGAALLAAMCWALSPMLIRYSHRMLAPTYVLPFFLAAVRLVAAGAARPSRLFLAGLAGGVAFTVYPGIYQAAGASALLLLDPRIRRIITARSAALLAAGGALPVLAAQGASVLAGHVEAGGYSYGAQLAALSHGILQGDLGDAWLFPFRFAVDSGDVVFLLLAAAVPFAAAARGGAARPWAAAALALYALWVLNGPVLGREVLYGRLVVLAYPLLIAGGALAVPARAWGRLSRPVALAATGAVMAGAAWGALVLPARFRPSVEHVREEAARRLGVRPGDLVVRGTWNDYGLHAERNRAELLAVPPAEPAVVAFNLRAISHPAAPRLDVRAAPLFTLPSPIRERCLQYEGHGQADRALIRSQPGLFDVKVFAERDLRRELGSAGPGPEGAAGGGLRD